MTTVSNQVLNETAPTAAMLPSQRRCLVSGGVKTKSDLVRFVLGPDGQIVPDIAERLPGRGLWVSADRLMIEEASRKNLFARAAKAQTQVPADLPDMVERLLARRCLELLGLARAAGAVVMREPMVLEALGGGVLFGLLLASDAGGDIRKKTSRANILSNTFTREELGAAVGRPEAAVLGLRVHPLCEKLQTELARLHGVRVVSSHSTDSNGKQ